MTESTLWTAIIQLQKLEMDSSLRESVEEAANLLTQGQHIEAEALVQNAQARARRAFEPAAAVQA
ncbi:MAG: hypothetical protein O2968_01080 [Acidobacteria bacterium]|nr:hypothetical protein [Acidobacteriota bacterium]